MTECNHLLLFSLKDDLGYVHDSKLTHYSFQITWKCFIFHSFTPLLIFVAMGQHLDFQKKLEKCCGFIFK